MENENKKLDAREVAAFLKQNPGFFRSYPDVVAELDVPHETGATVSLVEHQSRILREKKIVNCIRVCKRWWKTPVVMIVCLNIPVA